MKAAIITAAVAVPVLVFADLYRFVFYRSRSRLSTALLDGKTHVPEYYPVRDGNKARLNTLAHDRFTMLSDRGETLCGFLFPCEGSRHDRIAFIVHGYHSDHAETAGMLFEYYHSRGFDVFCPDNTATGESGGKFFGYGFFESADCLKWLEILSGKYPKAKLVLHGFSLGGASVLMASDRVPDCVSFIVDDSGFIKASRILRKQLGILYTPMRLLNRLVAGYDVEDADVTEHVKNAKVPVLVVHGEDDPTVPVSMGREIYELLPVPKDALFSKGVRHIETSWLAMPEYTEKLDMFIERYLNNKKTAQQ